MSKIIYSYSIQPKDTTRDIAYRGICDYFENPTMTKIKDIEFYSMYASKSYSLLSREHRYLIVLIKEDNNPIAFTIKLNELKWESLQTRTLEDNHKIATFNYSKASNSFVEIPITLKERSRDYCSYTCNSYPMLITIYNSKGSNYQNTGWLINALETYQTIITFN